jgi:hypothetical protein
MHSPELFPFWKMLRISGVKVSTDRNFSRILEILDNLRYFGNTVLFWELLGPLVIKWTLFGVFRDIFCDMF